MFNDLLEQMEKNDTLLETARIRRVSRSTVLRFISKRIQSVKLTVRLQKQVCPLFQGLCDTNSTHYLTKNFFRLNQEKPNQTKMCIWYQLLFQKIQIIFVLDFRAIQSCRNSTVSKENEISVFLRPYWTQCVWLLFNLANKPAVLQ